MREEDKTYLTNTIPSPIVFVAHTARAIAQGWLSWLRGECLNPIRSSLMAYSLIGEAIYYSILDDVIMLSKFQYEQRYEDSSEYQG